MRTYFLGAFFISFALLSCGKQKESDHKASIEELVPTKISEKDISKFKFLEYSIDIKTEKEIENWSSFKELEDLVIRVKKGDLSYFKDNNDAIVKFVIELKEKIPDTLNTPSVNARINALETKILKLESLYNLSSTSKEELSLIIKEFLESVSNLNLQMNKKLEKDSQIIETP
ncbi:hypothetical protein V8G56_06625 [Gaetbulibacter aquiaggeris]|uniref:Lipoprotein n=1 Tax=Gaetbulibacter aquiaggeris TaxID=1735373 RepID=A0ABW7MTA9_9FLAO